VLDGKLAVSCNLKSAYAGLNSERRILLSLNLFFKVVFTLSALRNNFFIEPRQIWKEAAVNLDFMCREITGN